MSCLNGLGGCGSRSEPRPRRRTNRRCGHSKGLSGACRFDIIIRSPAAPLEPHGRMSLELFHPRVRQWFTSRFGQPTEPQLRGWPEIAAGRHTLIAAPTGSGKTLAAFLVCLDRLFRQWTLGSLADGTQVVYVSPLKALSNDIQRNLQTPLAEIAALAVEAGLGELPIRTAVRTGDTPAAERAKMLRNPPHILDR